MEHRSWWLGASVHAVPHLLPPACLPWKYSQHPFPWSLSSWGSSSTPPPPPSQDHCCCPLPVRAWVQVREGLSWTWMPLQSLRWGMGAAIPALGQHGSATVDRGHVLILLSTPTKVSSAPLCRGCSLFSGAWGIGTMAKRNVWLPQSLPRPGAWNTVWKLAGRCPPATGKLCMGPKSEAAGSLGSYKGLHSSPGIPLPEVTWY